MIEVGMDRRAVRDGKFGAPGGRALPFKDFPAIFVILRGKNPVWLHGRSGHIDFLLDGLAAKGHKVLKENACMIEVGTDRRAVRDGKFGAPGGRALPFCPWPLAEILRFTLDDNQSGTVSLLCHSESSEESHSYERTRTITRMRTIYSTHSPPSGFC
jgi:hypothetical protein